ncbi:hypothetical protein [Ralstonia solanacearum]|uniref:hypothetical protein n=1 Tax=Ralstonia solanacearum TaxID=305 RepID=UPI0018C2F829|nr:hypothetical protein [Ralstonia solanacearum]
MSSLGLGLAAALIAFLVSLIYSPFHAIMAASSPIYIWRYVNCYENPYWLTIFEAVLPFFILSGVFGFVFNIRPTLTAKFAVAVLLCFLICSVLVWVMLDDYPQPSCGDVKQRGS